MFKFILAALSADLLAAPLLSVFLLLPSLADAQSRLPPCPNDRPNSSWNDCQGTHTEANGDRYVGAFRNGKENGQGTYTFATGQKYVGEFKDGSFNGQGTLNFLYGETVGEYIEGKPNGQGTRTFTDGRKYVGEFMNGKYWGQGTLTFADGQKYVGEFKEEKFDGQGTYYAANGSIISSGIWADGKFLGTIADLETIRMEKSGGVYVVPVRFNDTITLDAIIDSGAADVSIPADVVSTLMRMGTLKAPDFLGQKTYVLADGSKVPSQTFRIGSLKVSNKIIENVNGSIAPVQGCLQSFLGRFRSWRVDNIRHALILD
jgi:hypothetical protein